MDYEEIKNALIAVECPIPLLADVLDKSFVAVSGVAKRSTTSKSIALAICKALNEPPEKVFPDVPQYHSDFNPERERQKQIEHWRERLSA